MKTSPIQLKLGAFPHRQSVIIMAATENPIRFPFHWAKTLDAMYVIVSRLGAVDKVKLTKLLYLIDREHFLAHGTPITGDRLYAMPYGPVPSKCLEAINGDLYSPEQAEVHKLLHRDDTTLTIREGASRDGSSLTETERQIINVVLDQWGSLDNWAVVDKSHDLPEYAAVYQKGTSTVIPFEEILRAAGDDSHWRHNRPVLSRETAASMMPVLPPDPEL